MKNHDIQDLRNKKEDDDLPSKLGMKPRLRRYSERKYGNRRITENYNHMVRFLRANLGQPWDEVYSEIKKKDFFGSTINVDDYLFGQIITNPSFKDGVPYDAKGIGPIYKDNYGGFYVDMDGLLAESTLVRPPWNKKKPDPNCVKIDDTTYLVRRESDMVWFIVGYSKPVMKTYAGGNGRKYSYATHPGAISPRDLELPKVREHYASSMKTLSKKEKRFTT